MPLLTWNYLQRFDVFGSQLRSTTVDEFRNFRLRWQVEPTRLCHFSKIRLDILIGWLHIHVVTLYFQYFPEVRIIRSTRRSRVKKSNNCITPAAVIFNDVMTLVSRMVKSVKNVPFNEHGRSPESPIVCRSKGVKKPSLQKTAAGAIVLQTVSSYKETMESN